jgi:hypothetical protein
MLAGHGALALVAAVLLFRWEPGARAQIGRRGWWLVLVAAMWLALAVLAHNRARPVPALPDRAAAGVVADYVRGVGAPALPRKKLPVAQTHPKPLPPDQVRGRLQAGGEPVVPTQQPVPAVSPELPAPDLDAIAFERLPPDAGLVAPIAVEPADAALASALARIERLMAQWPPASEGDAVQQVRNLLLIAAVPDLLQMDPLERHLPLLVQAQLQARFGARLPALLAQVALDPQAGSVAARADLPALGLPAHTGTEGPVRGRMMLYAFKLLGRVTGRRVGDPA